jgi:hypothetical protein
VTSEVLGYAAIGVGTVAVVAGIVMVSLLAWRRQVRRYIVTLVGGRETISSAFHTVEGVSKTLATATDGELIAFALDPESEGRRALSDISERMAISADELQMMALPKRLWPPANALADAAALLGGQAGRVSGSEGVEVLDALGELDLVGVVSLLEAADAMLLDMRERYRVADDAVYGGGLYI